MLNRRSAVPLHYQFKRLLLDQITSGDLAPGARLLTEREYAQQFGISLAPIRQALSDLARQGYVERIKSRGTFVRPTKIEQKITALSSFTDSMHQTGLPVSLEVLRLERCRPSTEIARRLRLGPRAMIVLLRRRCRIKGEAVALLSSYLPAAAFPGLERRDLANVSLYHLLEDVYDCVLSRAESYIEVYPASEETGTLLEIAYGASLLRVEGITYRESGEIVEYADVLYRADRYRFFIESRKEEAGVVARMAR